MTNYYFPTIYIVPLITLSLNVKLTPHADACLDHNSSAWITSHFQKNETGKTRFVAEPINDTGFYFLAGRRHFFVTVHLIGYMQMRHRSYEIP